MGYLSDIARRRVAALLLLVAASVAVLAITDTGPFEDPPTEEERVAAAVARFYAAAGQGDFETYCGMLTGSARDQVRGDAARLLEEAGQLSCAEIMGVAEEAFRGLTATTREVSVSGVRARVEAVFRFPNGGAEPRTILLEQDRRGEWRVSDPGA